MKQLSDYERGFIEACIDTDGSIVLMAGRKKPSHTPLVRVSFHNNSSEFLYKIQDILGVSYKLILKKGSKNYKFSLSPRRTYKLLLQLTLVIKENRRIVGIKIYEVAHSRFGITDREFLDKTRVEIKRLINEFYE